MSFFIFLYDKSIIGPIKKKKKRKRKKERKKETKKERSARVSFRTILSTFFIFLK